jgi:hypothetical protein
VLERHSGSSFSEGRKLEWLEWDYGAFPFSGIERTNTSLTSQNIWSLCVLELIFVSK